MHFVRILFGAACLCVLVALTVRPSKECVSLTHMVDLTHTLSGQFPFVPIAGITFPFDQRPVASVENNGVFAEEWHMIAHNGTHMDAPIHYIEGGRAMDAYDVRELIVPSEVIDIHERAGKDRDTQLQLEDIRNWESRYGRIPSHSAVLMYSGWDRKAIEDPTDFVGLDDFQATHFPTFSLGAIAFLVKERDVAGIGIDTLSFDQVEPTQKAPAHKILLGANKWGIECINNLEAIPP